MTTDLGSVLTGGGVAGAIAMVVLGIIKAVDVYRKTGHSKEADLVSQLQGLNAAESARAKLLEDKYDALRHRFDDAVDQNGKFRHILHSNDIPIPPDLADSP